MSTLKYLNQESSQTLRQAIQELRQAEGFEGDASEYVSSDLLEDIELHDVIHTVFACPTNLRGEILAHVWSVFGTTLEIKQMHRVNRHSDHKAVLRQIGHARLFKTWLRSLPNILVVAWRASRMKQRWPATSFQQFLDTPLFAIRATFNIKVLDSRSRHNTSSGAALRSIRASSNSGNVA